MTSSALDPVPRSSHGVAGRFLYSHGQPVATYHPQCSSSPSSPSPILSVLTLIRFVGAGVPCRLGCHHARTTVFHPISVARANRRTRTYSSRRGPRTTPRASPRAITSLDAFLRASHNPARQYCHQREGSNPAAVHVSSAAPGVCPNTSDSVDCIGPVCLRSH